MGHGRWYEKLSLLTRTLVANQIQAGPFTNFHSLLLSSPQRPLQLKSFLKIQVQLWLL